MKKYRFTCLIGILQLFILASCQEEESSSSVFPGKTVLVYMVADNSLSDDAQINMDSLAVGFKRNEVVGNLLVYVDRLNEKPALLQIVKNENDSVIWKTIATYEEQNSASVEVLSAVLKVMKKQYPSESYGLVLWSHGYGWLPATVTKTTTTNAQAVALRWFGLDGTDKMDIPDLMTALNTGPYFDYILFDACFMGSIETAYALRNCADYLIASPTEEMAEGFPYSEIVPYMLGSSKTDYIQIASLFYEHYKALTGYYRSASIGCIKCSELDTLAVKMNELVNAHIADLDTFDIDSVQPLESYSPHLFYDFGHFVERFTTKAEYALFEQLLNKAVLFKACTENILSVNGNNHYFPVNQFSGLNTYIPCNETINTNTSYQTTAWYSVVGWSKTRW